VAPGTENEISLVKEQRQLTDELSRIEGVQHDTAVMLGVYKNDLEIVAKERELDVNLVEAWLPRFQAELKAALEGDGVTNAEEEALAKEEESRDALAGEYAVLEDQISGSEAAFQHTLAKIAELKKTSLRKALEDEVGEAAREHPGRKYCCQPIEVARLKCHLCKQAEADKQSAAALYSATEPDSMLAMLEKSAEIHKDVLTRERAERESLGGKLKTAKEVCVNIRTELANKRHKHVRNASKLSVTLAILDRFNTAQKAQAGLSDTYTDTQKKHRVCSDSLSKKRDKHKPKFARLTDVFNQLIEFVLGDDVNGSVTMSGGMIELGCSYKGDLKSSAIRAVQTVCFDLATLVLSIEGHGNHPRFLLHDSPRVADLTGTIFHRYFWLARKLEELANENPTFQYIITTTEPPPEKFQFEPWRVAKLDASTKDGRLLHENL
jgi:hypothetical protein